MEQFKTYRVNPQAMAYVKTIKHYQYCNQLKAVSIVLCSGITPIMAIKRYPLQCT